MRKKTKSILTIITITCFFMAGIYLSKTTMDNIFVSNNKDMSQQSFKEFTDEMFADLVDDDSITLNYMLSKPENYGIQSDPATFGSISINSFVKQRNYAEEKLSQLKTYNYSELSKKEKIVYDTIKWNLELELKFEGYDLYREFIAPDTGISCQLPIILAEYHFYDKASIHTYLQMLPDIYDYFSGICEFEKEKSKNKLFMSDSAAQKVINQCDAFTKNPSNNLLINVFNEKIDSFPDLSNEEKEAYKKKNKDIVLNKVIPAYNLLEDTITSLKDSSTNTGSLFNYEKGKEFYSLLATSNTGTSRSIEEIITLLDNTILSDTTSMFALIAKNPELINDYLVSDFGYYKTDEIIKCLKNSMSTDFPTIDNINHTVKTVPSSLSEYMSPAFYMISPYDNYTNNVIYINKYANSSNSLFTNLAHEAYPGHLYQNTYFCQKNKYPILNILSNIGYQEGYASYVTVMSYNYSKMEKDIAKLCGLNNSLILCLSARADIGIHYEGWDLEKVKSFFSENNYSLDNSSAEELYNVIICDPGNYLTYAVGYAEILAMKNKAELVLKEDFNLKNFHTFLLDMGPVPFDIIYKYFYEFIE